MPFKIVRNDITRMHTEAIVNTANDQPTVGTGCDHAVYKAAGRRKLLAYRKKYIGPVPEGEVFMTPGFRLPARYIIHAVSPLYYDGRRGEEDLLRSCYRKSLALAAEKGIRSIAFPLISTGGFGYPKEEGMRIAVDEIHAFLLNSDMQVYLVVFDEKASRMGKRLYPDLQAYIDLNYVEEKEEEEYDLSSYDRPAIYDSGRQELFGGRTEKAGRPESNARMKARGRAGRTPAGHAFKRPEKDCDFVEDFTLAPTGLAPMPTAKTPIDEDAAIEEMERRLADRMKHMSDSLPEYLLYLIRQKGMKNSEVYKRAIVDKKVFSKIKNNPDYHPQKLTALCLCVGARLNMDETRDLLARAGYALSPCSKTDIIFSYFIEHGIYDMIELDIQLEEHGLPCVIH